MKTATTRHLMMAMASVALALLELAAYAGDYKIEEINEIKPAPGREVVKPMAPDWCGSYKAPEHGNPVKDADDTLGVKIREEDVKKTHAITRMGYEDYEQLVARAACTAPNEPSVQQQVAYWRQLEINLSGLSERDDRAALKLVIDGDRVEKQQAELKAKFAPWARDEKLDEGTRAFRRVIQGLVMGSNTLLESGYGSTNGLEFFLDTPGRKTGELERMAYAYACLQGSMPEIVATCGPDARRLSVKAADDEARALGFNELGRLRVHTYAVAVKARYADAEAELMKYDQRSPDFHMKKYVLERPEQAFAAWDAFYAAHKDAYDKGSAAEAVYWRSDDTGERGRALAKADLGQCGAYFRDQYIKAATAMKPKTTSDYNLRLAGDSWIQYLLEHAALCDLAEGRPLDAWAFLQLLRDGVNYGQATSTLRGPRFAVHAATLADEVEEYRDQGGKMAMHAERGDDQLYRELVGLVGNGPPLNWVRCEQNDCSHAEGTISAIKKTGSAVVLTFKKASYWQRAMECKPSNKVRRIMSGGTVEYEQDCHATGWFQVSRQQEPITVSDASAAGLKVGQWVRFGVTDKDRTLWGFPIEVIQPSTAKGKPEKVLAYALIPVVP